MYTITAEPHMTLQCIDPDKVQEPQLGQLVFDMSKNQFMMYGDDNEWHTVITNGSFEPSLVEELMTKIEVTEDTKQLVELHEKLEEIKLELERQLLSKG